MIDIRFYQEHFNLQKASFSRIDHEDAMVALVYKITQKDGTQFILKIYDRRKDYLRELQFLKCLADKVPVPKLRQALPPRAGTDGAILMECLPGELLKASEMTQTLAHELGRSLALIHNHRLSGYGDPVEEVLTDDPKEYFKFKFEEGIDECKNHLPSDLIEACQNYYASHLHLVSIVDGPCVVHRDFRPGNLMVFNGKLQGIIDWAGARASFAEEDFCYLEHEEWLSQHMRDFQLGYASIRPIPQYKSLLSFLSLNKAIATIGFTVKQDTWKKAHARVYQFNRQFLEKLLPKDQL